MSYDQRDYELVARASDGDKDAFGDLYERHLDAIFRYIYYRVNHQQDAEDLTEVVFLKAWQSISSCHIKKAAFKSWVYRIAHNSVIDHYRTRKETQSIGEVHSLVDEEMDLEATISTAEKAAELAQTMGQLSPIHQHVLTLRFINGLSPTETAEVLERSAGAVRVMQHRALKALHALLVARQGN